MIDQSIFIVLKSKSLQDVVLQMSDFLKFIKRPQEINNQFESHLWLKYLNEEFYFSLYAEDLENGKIILDFDCIDRNFVDFLVKDPNSILQFFIDSIIGSEIAYWVVNPPDVELKDIYINLIKKKDIEIAFHSLSEE